MPSHLNLHYAFCSQQLRNNEAREQRTKKREVKGEDTKERILSGLSHSFCFVLRCFMPTLHKFPSSYKFTFRSVAQETLLRFISHLEFIFISTIFCATISFHIISQISFHILPSILHPSICHSMKIICTTTHHHLFFFAIQSRISMYLCCAAHQFAPSGSPACTIGQADELDGN